MLVRSCGKLINYARPAQYHEGYFGGGAGQNGENRRYTRQVEGLISIIDDSESKSVGDEMEFWLSRVGRVSIGDPGTSGGSHSRSPWLALQIFKFQDVIFFALRTG